MIDFGRYRVEKVPEDLLNLCAEAKEDLQPFKWRNILFKPTFASGHIVEIKNYVADLRNLRLTLIDEVLMINNSLHKFFKGNNYCDFTHTELIESIDLLSGILGIADTEIIPHYLEVGINFKFASLVTFLNSIDQYKQKVFLPMKKGSAKYGKKIDMTEVFIKAYNKSQEYKLHSKEKCPEENILRLEVGFKNKRQFSFVRSLADLKNVDTFKKLIEKFFYYFERIDFTENYDLGEILTRDLELLYAGRSVEFWKNLKKSNYEVYKKRWQKYRRIKAERAIPSAKDEVLKEAGVTVEMMLSN